MKGAKPAAPVSHQTASGSKPHRAGTATYHDGSRHGRLEDGAEVQQPLFVVLAYRQLLVGLQKDGVVLLDLEGSKAGPHYGGALPPSSPPAPPLRGANSARREEAATPTVPLPAAPFLAVVRPPPHTFPLITALHRNLRFASTRHCASSSSLRKVQYRHCVLLWYMMATASALYGGRALRQRASRQRASRRARGVPGAVVWREGGEELPEGAGRRRPPYRLVGWGRGRWEGWRAVWWRG